MTDLTTRAGQVERTRDQVLSLWWEGNDTESISKCLMVPEALAYSIIANRNPAPVTKQEPYRNRFSRRVAR